MACHQLMDACLLSWAWAVQDTLQGKLLTCGPLFTWPEMTHFRPVMTCIMKTPVPWTALCRVCKDTLCEYTCPMMTHSVNTPVLWTALHEACNDTLCENTCPMDHSPWGQQWQTLWKHLSYGPLSMGTAMTHFVKTPALWTALHGGSNDTLCENTCPMDCSSREL